MLGYRVVSLETRPFESILMEYSTCVDRSSSHPNVHYKSLDWLDSLSDQEHLKSFFGEAKADIVLGADIVCIGARA